MIARVAAACLIADLTSHISPSLARGLCNIDSVGTPPERKNVAAAASQLHAGGKALLDSLTGFENEDRDAGQKAASAAVTSFKSAAESYKQLSSSLKVDLRRITEFEPGSIARAAFAAPNDVFQQLLSKAVQPDASQQLMAECGQAATRMADATAQFAKEVAETPDREMPYTRVLAEWGRMVYLGRVVSVMFESGKGRSQ